jgi:hypothetical protein
MAFRFVKFHLVVRQPKSLTTSTLKKTLMMVTKNVNVTST